MLSVRATHREAWGDAAPVTRAGEKLAISCAMCAFSASLGSKSENADTTRRTKHTRECDACKRGLVAG